MKCPICGNDLFKGQLRCEKCGMIVEVALALKKAEAPKVEVAKETKKTKKSKEK